MDLVEYSSPDTNPNYFNDYEIDEFEEADATNEAEKDGTWDEDLPEFDFNIDFELDDLIIQNNPTNLPPNPNRRFNFRREPNTQTRNSIIRRSSSSSNSVDETSCRLSASRRLSLSSTPSFLDNNFDASTPSSSTSHVSLSSQQRQPTHSNSGSSELLVVSQQQPMTSNFSSLNDMQIRNTDEKVVINEKLAKILVHFFVEENDHCFEFVNLSVHVRSKIHSLSNRNCPMT